MQARPPPQTIHTTKTNATKTKVVASERGLKKHMLIHGDTPFPCTFPGCGRAFTDAAKLAKHAFVHATAKNWHCPLCGRAFVAEAYVKSHWKKSHAEVPMPASFEEDPQQQAGAGGGGGGAAAPG